MSFKALAFGVAGGAAVAGGAWFIIDRLIDKRFEREANEFIDAARPALRSEIKSELTSRIPGQVGEAIDEKLGEYGITPKTGRQIATVLDYADTMGLIGVRGR